MCHHFYYCEIQPCQQIHCLISEILNFNHPLLKELDEICFLKEIYDKSGVY